MLILHYFAKQAKRFAFFSLIATKRFSLSMSRFQQYCGNTHAQGKVYISKPGWLKICSSEKPYFNML